MDPELEEQDEATDDGETIDYGAEDESLYTCSGGPESEEHSQGSAPRLRDYAPYLRERIAEERALLDVILRFVLCSSEKGMIQPLACKWPPCCDTTGSGGP